jgi:hypothetical protein
MESISPIKWRKVKKPKRLAGGRIGMPFSIANIWKYHYIIEPKLVHFGRKLSSIKMLKKYRKSCTKWW